ncbi:MAG TPA: hypothetical protein VF212_15305 [Longimicrobiales bacterium]
MAARRRSAAGLLAIVASLLALPAPLAAQRPDTVWAGPLAGIHWPGGRRLAERVLSRVRRMPPLPALPPGALDGGPPVRVFFAPDPARFDSLTGARAPEWGAAIAIPAENAIVLPGYFSERGAPHDLVRTLRHELAHIALHRYLAPATPPRWFDEGYARIAAGEWDLDAAWQLRLAFATGRAPHLDSLALDWPRGAVDARVAYLLSTTAVAFLLERGGERALAIFLQRWKASGSLDAALRRTYGLTLGQFEHDWRQEVRQDYGWAYFLANSAIFWVFLGLLFLLLYIRRRRQTRARLEALRAQEPPDLPAYWLGEEGGGEGGDEGEAAQGRPAGGTAEDGSQARDSRPGNSPSGDRPPSARRFRAGRRVPSSAPPPLDRAARSCKLSGYYEQPHASQGRRRVRRRAPLHAGQCDPPLRGRRFRRRGLRPAREGLDRRRAAAAGARLRGPDPDRPHPVAPRPGPATARLRSNRSTFRSASRSQATSAQAIAAR